MEAMNATDAQNLAQQKWGSNGTALYDADATVSPYKVGVYRFPILHLFFTPYGLGNSWEAAFADAAAKGH